MVRLKALVHVLFGAFLLAPTFVLADDFAPPPWLRSHPNAITAEWEFSTPANPATPDGGLTNVFSKGSGSVPTTATIVGEGGLGWGPGDGDGGWFFPAGGSVRFEVDNVIDFEPIKFLRLQVTHTPGLVFDLDPLLTFNVGATGSAPGLVTATPVSPIYTLFTWEMHPNPPWEGFLLLTHGVGEIDQVVVDTISTGIPEPSTFLCYALVLASLGFVFRAYPRVLKLVLN
jgi:hypothetical protein